MNKILTLTFLILGWSIASAQNYSSYQPQIGDDRCDPEWNLARHYSYYDWTDEFQMLDEENNKPYVGSASWYYDPETPGIGLSMTLQQSVHSPSGYFGFGVFYTYNQDGSQAWFPVDGFYEPTYNDDEAYWQYDTDYFGVHVKEGSTLFNSEDEPFYLYRLNNCWWGHENTYLGELSSALVKTSGGAVVDGAYSPHQYEQVGDVRIRWRSPDKVEVYINGANEPQHTFIRHKFNAGSPARNADFLLDNTYYLDTTYWNGIWKKQLWDCWDFDNNVPTDPEWGCMNVVFANRYKGAVEFKRFDHRTDMPDNNTPSIGDDFDQQWRDQNMNGYYYPNNWAAENFHRSTGWVERHVNYISKECLPLRNDFTVRSPLATPLYQQAGSFGYVNHYETPADWCTYIILSYDPLYDSLSAYYAQTWYDDNDVKRGLSTIMSGYKFKAPLPQSDSALINLFPSTDYSSNNSFDDRPWFMNRSHFTLHRLPKLGGLFKELPNVYIDVWNLDVERGE